MEFPPLPADLTIIVAGLASIISAWLRDDGLSNRANGVIALLALVVTAAACIFLTTGFTSDLKSDVLLLIAVSFLLAGKEFLALASYFQNATSPMAPRIPARASASSIRATVKDLSERGE